MKGGAIGSQVTPEQKEMIVRAAALRGSSVMELVVASAQQSATKAIKDYADLSARRGLGRFCYCGRAPCAQSTRA
jgi:uncharacterized protein (DUF1778 family)